MGKDESRVMGFYRIGYSGEIKEKMPELMEAISLGGPLEFMLFSGFVVDGELELIFYNELTEEKRGYLEKILPGGRYLSAYQVIATVQLVAPPGR